MKYWSSPNMWKSYRADLEYYNITKGIRDMDQRYMDDPHYVPE